MQPAMQGHETLRLHAIKQFKIIAMVTNTHPTMVGSEAICLSGSVQISLLYNIAIRIIVLNTAIFSQLAPE